MNRQDNIQREMEQYLNTIQLWDESMDDHLFLWDLQEDRVYFADSIYEKYPIVKSENGTTSIQDWTRIIYKRDLNAVSQTFRKVKENKCKTYNLEYRILDKSGNRDWVNSRGSVRFDSQGRARFVAGRVSDTMFRNRTDGLTGLLNSVKLMEDLETCLKRGDTGCLMILGIDNLKNINIKHGMSYGNWILALVAEVMEEVNELPSLVYRLNGDCFAINLVKYSREEAERLYRTIQQSVEKYCTVSAGAVLYDEKSVKDNGILYQYAENALDSAKKEGKNRLIFFSIDNYEKKLNMIELLEELQNSVKNGFQGFYLCYQPQIKGDDFTLFGAEALLRFSSPSRGTVSPAEFIPILEQTGLICQVGAWVLETALIQCREWRRHIPGVHINVNISYIQLRQKDIAASVLDVLERVGISGEALTLEVTESIQLQDYEYFNQIFSQWKRQGVKIAIDDFGTGYSSLSYLKSIEIDEVKIDRCFVRQIQNSAYNYQLLRNVIELAHSVHIRVCCEGVETEEELFSLMELHPDVIQGYLFAEPYEKEKFEAVYMKPEVEEYRKRIVQEERFRCLHSDDLQRFYGVLNSNYRQRDILKNTRLGLWVIRMNPEKNQYEMYADRVMLEIMGVEGIPTPEECYQHWYGRIQQGYYQYVNNSVEKLIKTGKAMQLEYTWKHPRKGEVMVNCLGVRVEDNDGMICLEGHHRIISEVEKPQFLLERTHVDSFEYNEKNHAIYFHTKRKLLLGDADREKNFPDCWIEEKIVHPHFADKFRGVFLQVDRQPEVNGLEVLLKAKSGTYEWFWLKTQHLGMEKQDLETILVSVEPASQEWAMKLEYMRTQDFYEAVLGEAVAYAEVDVESGYPKRAGGLWESYVEECRQKQKSFTQVILSHMPEVILEEEQEDYSRYMDVEFMKNMYKNGESTCKHCFRRMMDGGRYWVELVVHVFQERYSGNMYALLYLKNIDVEKRKALAQEVADNRDPLTNVYNRRTFEQEVISFMTDSRETAGGSLIILDLDDFKKINDNYGHLVGDRALKILTDTLMATFRRRDIIGRLGGDEFLVFIKSVTSREILDKRMKELFVSLAQTEELNLTCSVGICIMEREGFSYEEGLKKADTALYKSKKEGKNRYSYYEETRLSES